MSKNYVYTDLSVQNSLFLQVEGIDPSFPITQFSSSWSLNEIPTAAALLAVGRDARTNLIADIHTTAAQFKQMMKAKVWFSPKGEYDRGIPWPEGQVVIFEGYFTGLAYRKIMGKVHLIVNLIHWLAALSFSSALTGNGHVSNPTQLNAAAVLNANADPGAGPGCYIASHVSGSIVASDLSVDLWKNMKRIFCFYANFEALQPVGAQQECGGDGTVSTNVAAQYALGKIEGPATGCDVPYKWGVPLAMDTQGISEVENAIGLAIGQEFVESYSAVSFWDKLVGQWCPMFSMAVVPMVNTAIIIADTPAYNTKFWREIEIDDTDSYDLSRELHRPLRAVGVIANYGSQTGAGNGNPADDGPGSSVVVGGCYSESSVAPGDGMIMYVAAPIWLSILNTMPVYVNGTQSFVNNRPVPTATTPGLFLTPSARDLSDSTLGRAVNSLYQRYAQTVFVNQMLRGQSGAFSGKLRFDVAPGSIVKVNAATERFIGPGQDSLADSIVGCVQRVTISINAESSMAGTSFQLSHVRTVQENQLPRTSVTEHPLFGKSIHGAGKHGCPLLDVYEFPNPSPIAPPS